MRLLKIGVAALSAALALGLGAAAWVAAGLFLPAGSSEDARPFVVRSGEPLGAVVRRLDEEGLLPRRLGFGPRVVVAYAKLLELDRDVKTGEYVLSPSLTPREILTKLSEGAVATRSVTLPEGLNLWEIAERVEAEEICSADALLELAFSAAFVAELGVQGSSLEGYLYPETYRFERGAEPALVLRTMVEHGREQWTERDHERLASSELSLHEVVSLASIVEKETGAAEERPVIAAVFLNRLERGMRLQSDPTVIYGLLLDRGEFDGNLRKIDLQTRRPYNTYRMGGITPGPIASTGMDSIRAVLEPADVSYLYFVSRNDGTHEFSRTLQEHNRAVQRYQKRGRS